MGAIQHICLLDSFSFQLLRGLNGNKVLQISLFAVTAVSIYEHQRFLPNCLLKVVEEQAWIGSYTMHKTLTGDMSV